MKTRNELKEVLNVLKNEEPKKEFMGEILWNFYPDDYVRKVVLGVSLIMVKVPEISNNIIMYCRESVLIKNIEKYQNTIQKN